MTTNLSQNQTDLQTAVSLAIQTFDYEMLHIPTPEHRTEIYELFEIWRGTRPLSSFLTMQFINDQVYAAINSNQHFRRFLHNFDAKLRLAWADKHSDYTKIVITSHCTRKEISSELFYLLNKNLEQSLHVDEKDLLEFSSSNPWYIGLYLVLAYFGHSTLKATP